MISALVSCCNVSH